MSAGTHRCRALPLAAVALLLVSQQAAFASITAERELGDNFIREARARLPLVESYEVHGLVTELGRGIVSTLGLQPFDYEFEIVADRELNAFAAPGGKVFVHAGLVARVANEDELAGVLGHEVAHSHAHHVIRQQAKGAAASYASLLGMLLSAVHPAFGQVALAAGMGVRLKYQRDFEREADFLGVGYAAKAGHDPTAMLRFLRVLHGEQQLNPTYMPPYLFSHPLSGERMAYLEASLRKNEWQEKPVPPTWRLERARVIARALTEKRQEVVPDYEARLARTRGDERAKASELLGLLFVAGGEAASGIEHLERAEASGRKVAAELGRAYLLDGRFAEARPRLEAALAASPGNWGVVADIGVLDFQQGRYQDAVTRLEAAVELREGRTEILRWLGRALAKTGKRHEGFYRLAMASEREGRSAQALDYYQRALEGLDDGNPLTEKVRERVEFLQDQMPVGPGGIPRPGPRSSKERED